MKFREALGEVVREQRLANGLHLRDVSDKGHLSYSFLSEVERGLKECSSDLKESQNPTPLRTLRGFRITRVIVIFSETFRHSQKDLHNVVAA